MNIRHRLNEGLLATGGHIGDGVRPSERGKGYGTQMIALALDECRKMGIDRVLMCCDETNPASAGRQPCSAVLDSAVESCTGFNIAR